MARSEGASFSNYTQPGGIKAQARAREMRPVPVMNRVDIGGDLSGIFSAAAVHAIGPCLGVYLAGLKRNDTGGCGVIFGGILPISRKTQ